MYQRVLAKRNNDASIPAADWDNSPTEWVHPGLADQPLKQVTSNAASYNCGRALDRFSQIFGRDNLGHARYTAGHKLYYKHVSSNFVYDLKFDADKVSTGARTIARLLREKRTAVTVFATNSSTFGHDARGVITHPGTHYVTIVGCSANERKFLIVDPWPRGSIMNYTSGIFGNVPSIFMSCLEYFQNDERISSLPKRVPGGYSEADAEKINRYENLFGREVLFGHRRATGSHEYVVIMGP
jgi:hypothetical protein